MTFSDFGALIKINGKLLTEEESDLLFEEIMFQGHGACGTKELYIEFYKTNFIVVYNDMIIFDKHSRSDLDANLDIGEVITPLLPIELNLKYYKYDNYRIMCNYIHPITKDVYEVLFGYGAGLSVYDWWKNCSGKSKEEIEEKCIVEF